MYLSQLTLRQSPSTKALGQLLNPKHEGRRMDAHHRLVWSAFASDSDAKRDFLWRQDGDYRFFVLSKKPPIESELFERPSTKDFEPNLRAGDQLSFRLRVNPTRTIKTGATTDGGKPRRKHRDVIMHALTGVAKEKRAELRTGLAQSATNEWLRGVGDRTGFQLHKSIVTGYRTLHVPGPRDRSPRFGVVDVDGSIEVIDPNAFLERLLLGYGRAKAFGCGLMLIRRL